jgi:hypothetical protein
MSSVSKILKFAKMNDEPVVLCSEKSDEDFVIMSIDKYRELSQNSNQQKTKNKASNLSKEQILKRINRNIELWRRKQQENRQSKKVAQLERELKDMNKMTKSQSNYQNLNELNYNYISSQNKNNSSYKNNKQITEKREIPPR